MQRRRLMLRTLALLTVGLCVVGCTSSGVTEQTVTPTSSSTAPSTLSASASPSPSKLDTSGEPTSASPAAADAEATDRAAAEAQWIKSWDVYLAMATTPAGERDSLAGTVAVDPAKSKMLADAQEFDKQGLQTYGQIGHRLSWPQPIDGADTAVIDDCQDRSSSGSLEISTGNKVSVGVAGLHYQGQMVRGSDGIWRVAQSYFLKDEPC